MYTTRKKHTTNHPSGFTLIEVLITVSLLAVGFAGIFAVMQNSTHLLEQTKNKTLAINLSRQAIEATHNIRDTNRTKRAGNKDACRLKIDPIQDTDNDGCQNDKRIQSGRYTLSGKTINDQKYFSLVPISMSGTFDTVQGAQDNSAQTQLCKSDTGWISCDDSDTTQIILRAIHISGLYAKNSLTTGGDSLSCPDGISSDAGLLCGGSDAKELRFCATTRVIGDQTSHSTLCSSLTNFTP